MHKKRKLAWNDERTAQLARFWAAGLSASTIAERLGGVSRNAVIGKLHRLGLSQQAAKPKAKAQPSTAARKPASPQSLSVQGAQALKPALAPSPAPSPRLAVVPRTKPEAEASGVTLIELKERMCRWPEGDPKTPEFRFCGARRANEGPYCARHAGLAHKPGKIARNRGVFACKTSRMHN